MNDAPTDIRLERTAKLNENSAEGVLIGTLQVIDQDSKAKASCQLLNTSNDRVKLMSMSLVAGPKKTDYESLGVSRSLKILIRCEDKAGASVTSWIRLPVEGTLKLLLFLCCHDADNRSGLRVTEAF